MSPFASPTAPLRLSEDSTADPVSSLGSLPEEPHFKSLPHSRYNDDGFGTPLGKTKSTSNLLSMRSGAPPPIVTEKRMSIDAGQLDRMMR